jgi:hypothetical protein
MSRLLGWVNPYRPVVVYLRNFLSVRAPPLNFGLRICRPSTVFLPPPSESPSGPRTRTSDFFWPSNFGPRISSVLQPLGFEFWDLEFVVYLSTTLSVYAFFETVLPAFGLPNELYS